jgi:ligand-binding SRPBCC domain-containing protein
VRRPATGGCHTHPVSDRILERSQRVAVTPDRAFDFYADALNLEPLTPPWLRFEVTNPEPLTMRAGALLDYRLHLHGFPIRWRTKIESWEPPHGFVDLQLKGPYALWHHTHTFEPDGKGGTIIGDHVRYRIPFGPLGALADRLFVRRDLKRIFDYRAEAVAESLGR